MLSALRKYILSRVWMYWQTRVRQKLRLSNHWTQNHRRTYNDCLSTQKCQNLERRDKKVLGLSWRGDDNSNADGFSSHLSGYELKAKQDTKKIPHSLFSHICIWCFRYRNIKGFGSRFGRNIRLLLATVTWAFSAEIVNVGQNYSIVVHRKGGIDKVSLQILVG